MPAAHSRSSAVFLNAYNVSAFLSSFDSTKTVDTHRQHVMDKLGLRSIAALTKYAVRAAITTLEA